MVTMSTAVITILLGVMCGLNDAVDWRILDGVPIVNSCDESTADIAKLCHNETSVLICYKKEPLSTVPCDPPTTLCDKEIADCVVPPPENDFICPAAFGYYPSLKSCNEYYICSNGLPNLQTCPTGNFVYAPMLMSCAAQSSERPCHRFPCTLQKTGKKVVYPGDPSMYAECGGSKAESLYECEHPEAAFNDNDQECRITCRREGNMLLDSGPCPRTYAECVSLGDGRFRNTTRTCPEGTHFNPKATHCVHSYCHPPFPPPFLPPFEPSKLKDFLSHLPQRLREIIEKAHQRKGFDYPS